MTCVEWGAEVDEEVEEEIEEQPEQITARFNYGRSTQDTQESGDVLEDDIFGF